MRRYAMHEAIPRPAIMKKIFEVTKGAVSANDFYELPSASYSHSPDGEASCDVKNPALVSASAGAADEFSNGDDIGRLEGRSRFDLPQLEMFRTGVSS